MLRARLTNGDFLFGLDAENIRRLCAGEPIVVDLKPLGGVNRFMLMYGQTLDDITHALEEVIGPLPEPTPMSSADDGTTL